MILEANYAAVKWITVDPSGRRDSGVLLGPDASSTALEDGAFALSTRVSKYRIRLKPEGAQAAFDGLRTDVAFYDNGTLDGYATLPCALSAQELEQFRKHLEELRAHTLPDGLASRYVSTYAEAALARPKWASDEPVRLADVRRLLNEIARKP